MDLTEPASVKEACATVVASGPLHGLVNNAGTALPGPLEYLPIDVFREQLEVNLVAQLAVTQGVLPALHASRRAGRQARIVFVGSIGGRIAGGITGGYHASKYALVGLSDALRIELRASGIDVILLEPGAVATPIWSRGAANGDRVLDGMPPEGHERYGELLEEVRAAARRSDANGIAASAVASVIGGALSTPNPRPRYLVGTAARVIAAMARVSFRLARRMARTRRGG